MVQKVQNWEMQKKIVAGRYLPFIKFIAEGEMITNYKFLVIIFLFYCNVVLAMLAFKQFENHSWNYIVYLFVLGMDPFAYAYRDRHSSTVFSITCISESDHARVAIPDFVFFIFHLESVIQHREPVLSFFYSFCFFSKLFVTLPCICLIKWICFWFSLYDTLLFSLSVSCLNCLFLIQISFKKKCFGTVYGWPFKLLLWLRGISQNVKIWNTQTRTHSSLTWFV